MECLPFLEREKALFLFLWTLSGCFRSLTQAHLSAGAKSQQLMLPCAGYHCLAQRQPPKLAPIPSRKATCTPDFLSASVKYCDYEICGHMGPRVLHRTMPSAELMLPAETILVHKLGIDNIFKGTH